MSTIKPETLQGDPEFIRKYTAIRHDIHTHPETAFEEVRTSDIVAAHLQKLGLSVHRGLGKTGVVGTLVGKRHGNRVIGLRADMDALFIKEETGLSYASKIDGKMHACGHDGHTTMLMGAAEKLAENPDFAGTVHFIFQPAEEGLGGARVMIEDGLFQRFPCDAVYAVHNNPKEPFGEVTTREGEFMTAGDTWKVVFKGSGGHGAMPDRSSDPTLPAGQFIASIGSIISRKIPAIESAVISVGHIHAGDSASPNIIPSTVTIGGTARTYLPEVRDKVEEMIGRLAKSLAEPWDIVAEVTYIRRYPTLVNSPSGVITAQKAAEATFGEDKVNVRAAPMCTSEDFAFMLEKVPGAYVLIGNGDGPESAYVHTPKYDFNDALIPLGVCYWHNLVMTELG